MFTSPDRRAFLAASVALPVLDGLRPVTATEAAIDPDLVRLDSGIEPLVQVLETTPRDRLIEELTRRIKSGLSYQEFLAGLLLAGVRNVPPRPAVGFKFHAVLVINSAHQASLAGPDSERWLPLLWAADNFKSSQAQTIKEGGWRMRPADESKLPSARKARSAFTTAMDTWDEQAADVAVATLARTAGANELFDLFARFGCRDYRAIGHKAIFVANAFRTLQTIGWQHAEPVLRSLAYALLQHEGDNPAKRDATQDRPGRRNVELALRIRDDWFGGTPNPAATDDLLATVRSGNDTEVAEAVVKQLNDGVSPVSMWDALFLAGGELLLRQPGIVALHSLTTLNALRYAFATCSDDSTRRLLLLQAASFLPLFRTDMSNRGKVSDTRIDKLEPADEPASVTAVFDTLTKDKAAAARLALAVLKSQPATGGKALIDAGRRLVIRKGTDSHDFKFSSAVMEDYARLTPAYRDRFLAASVYWLKGTAGPDSPLVNRVRSALG